MKKTGKRKQTQKQKMLLRQTLIQITIGVFMIVAYPRLSGFIIGGLIIMLGFLFAAMYMRDRRDNG